jgi:hypothetical protein
MAGLKKKDRDQPQVLADWRSSGGILAPRRGCEGDQRPGVMHPARAPFGVRAFWGQIGESQPTSEVSRDRASPHSYVQKQRLEFVQI